MSRRTFLTTPICTLVVVLAVAGAGCSPRDLQDAAVKIRVRIEDTGDAANASRQLAAIPTGSDEPLVEVRQAPVADAQPPAASDPTSLYAAPQAPFGQSDETPPPEDSPSYFK